MDAFNLIDYYLFFFCPMNLFFSPFYVQQLHCSYTTCLCSSSKGKSGKYGTTQK